jgi:hypothetical protein
MFAIPSFFGYNTTFVSTPVATAATGVGETSFTANWNAFAGATYYLLDVSTSSSFSSFVLEDEVVLAPTTAYLVAGLTANTTYYYRLRASTDAPPTPITATGGTITFAGGMTIHTFTSSGTFTVLTAGAGATVEALVVAGGGGGGAFAGGGGGAGGLIYNASKSIAVQAYTITVGSGGAAPTSNTGGNTNGNNSVFDSLTAIGGGRGGVQGTGNGQNGGSGGGSDGEGGVVGGTATAGQGNNGGSGAGGTVAGGGGGGAGAVGANRSGGNGGAGGVGLAYSISGTSTFYAGGGGASGSGTITALGGNGGGGNGEQFPITPAATNGTANTGGGGGAMYVFNPDNGGNGGSGIVIISYPT